MRAGFGRILVAMGVLVCASTPLSCSSSEDKGGSDGDDTGGEAGSTGGSAGTSRGGDAGEGGDSGRGGTSQGGRGGTSQGGSAQGGTAGESGAGTGGAGAETGGEGGVVEPCAECPNNACLEDGTCVECTEDNHCEGETPRCDTDANECVECLPSNDNCPDGQRCETSFTCTPGCKEDGSSCASGSCLPSGDCERCIRDGECIGGRVCANGECTDPCTGEGMSCGTSNTCCSMHCVDTTHTIMHCGGCSGSMPEFACAYDEFCGTMGCTAAIIANLCQNEGAVVMVDGLPANEAAGGVLGMALAACSPAPSVRSVQQNVLDVSNPTTGQPVVGPGELLLIAGGAFGQRVAEFFHNEKIAPLRQVVVNNRYELHLSVDDSIVAPAENVGPTHDVVFFQVVRDPATGTLVFNVGGFHQSGTAAGAWYFQNVMIPVLSTFTKHWYVYEWTDGGGNGVPDGSDTFALLAEAP